MQARAARPPIRLMHFVYSFHMGGLENVVIQLINRLPADQYQHCLVSLTDMGDFVDRIQTPGVERVSLHKPPGHAIPLYPALFRLFCRYRHTRQPRQRHHFQRRQVAGVQHIGPVAAKQG